MALTCLGRKARPGNIHVSFHQASATNMRNEPFQSRNRSAGARRHLRFGLNDAVGMRVLGVVGDERRISK